MSGPRTMRLRIGTVKESTFLTRPIVLNQPICGDSKSGRSIRSMANLTAVASNGAPLWNLTARLSFTARVLSSSARSPIRSAPVAGRTPGPSWPAKRTAPCWRRWRRAHCGKSETA
jgi:hypothetical protein